MAAISLCGGNRKMHRRRGWDRDMGREGETFEEFSYFSPSALPHFFWVKIPASSFLITSAMFVVFILDMASPGYGTFALIPDLRPQISTLTADIRSDLENLIRSESVSNTKKLNSPSGFKSSLGGESPQQTFSPDKSNNCQTLLDSYKTGAKCHFEPTNYSDTSR
jgi:hypothetical protein